MWLAVPRLDLATGRTDEGDRVRDILLRINNFSLTLTRLTGIDYNGSHDQCRGRHCDTNAFGDRYARTPLVHLHLVLRLLDPAHPYLRAGIHRGTRFRPY